MKRLRDLGEFGFIDQVAAKLGAGDGVITGVGDDCAVLRSGSETLLVTCDASVEDVHFRRESSSAADIGWKVATSAISDIAAMGGCPRFLLVTLAAPGETEVALLEGMYEGISAAASKHGASVVGGDTTRSLQRLVIDVMVIGVPGNGAPRLRSGATTGDVFAVTGHPGCSAGGLMALQMNLDLPDLLRAHRHPEARVSEGLWLAERQCVHAMIDVSDGLLQDAGHLARASHVGIDFDLDLVPVSPFLKQHEKALGLDPRDLVLTGGEDYELLVACEAAHFDDLRDAFEHRFGLPFSPLGRATDAWEGVRIGGEEAPRDMGYDHFRH